ncbi:hypothetical protein GTY65_34660 [Streptomyces sp. SID8379]|uniref:CAP domain-containing protein n=1 Tax=unclassified Streptomyces TaxID=2593676 RepID=UPI00131A3C34|nr:MULTISPECIES: CAP domain-containing protein [unclassified Streptomyces]MYW69176.1 hypothetical protein [Streptomyces sp. SID8379]
MAVATAVASMAGLAGTAAPATAVDVPGSTPGVVAPAYSPDVDWITCRINEERTARGLPGLRLSDTASRVGRDHARDMADQGELASVGSDGRDLRTRLNDAGLYSADAEEYLYSGYHHDGYFADMVTDPDPGNDIFPALMNRKFTAIGIGYDRTYWDVNLLGPHRKLVTRAPVCADTE